MWKIETMHHCVKLTDQLIWDRSVSKWTYVQGEQWLIHGTKHKDNQPHYLSILWSYIRYVTKSPPDIQGSWRETWLVHKRTSAFVIFPETRWNKGCETKDNATAESFDATVSLEWSADINRLAWYFRSDGLCLFNYINVCKLWLRWSWSEWQGVRLLFTRS